MTIEITKTTTEMVELKTPAYYVNYGCYYKINKDAIMTVVRNCVSVNEITAADKTVADAITSKPCTEAEFENAYHAARAAQERFMSNAILVSPIPEGMIVSPLQEDKNYKNLEHEMNRRDIHGEGEE
jgi:hypothetical protein